MKTIGRYEILGELGRGSMGAVFKARDPQIGRTVAIKIILTANLPKEENELYRSRFVREAQAAGQMQHPGIVTIHDIAEDESGQPFLVMEFVEGNNLHKMLRANEKGKIVQTLPLDQTLDLCAQVADALEYAHARGVVHRDIKPGNIIVTPDGRAKIADFGIARLSGTEATHTASITGTPAYMSPEQFRGGAIDKRSDIFSLGAMLYWMTTGEKPFPGDNVTQVSFNVVYREPAPPRQLVPALPKDLDVVLSRCLAKRAENRYAHAGEVAADLRALREGRPVSATAAPPEATVEDTVVTMGNVTPVGAPVKEDGDATAKSAPKRGSFSLIFAAFAVLAVLATGVWYGWKQATDSPAEAPLAVGADAGAKDKSPATAVPPNAAPAKGPSDIAGPAPAAKAPLTGGNVPPEAAAPETAAAARKAVGKAGVIPAGSGIMAIDLRHRFEAATIQIYSNGKLIYDGVLERETDKGALPERLAVLPGKRTILVKVHSPRDKYIEEKHIEGDFVADQARTLEVRFGFRNRSLALKWKK